MISTISTRFNQLHTAMIRMLSRLCVVHSTMLSYQSESRALTHTADQTVALRAIISKVRWELDDAAMTVAGDDDDIFENGACAG